MCQQFKILNKKCQNIKYNIEECLYAHMLWKCILKQDTESKIHSTISPDICASKDTMTRVENKPQASRKYLPNYEKN